MQRYRFFDCATGATQQIGGRRIIQTESLGKLLLYRRQLGIARS